MKQNTVLSQLLILAIMLVAGKSSAWSQVTYNYIVGENYDLQEAPLGGDLVKVGPVTLTFGSNVVAKPNEGADHVVIWSMVKHNTLKASPFADAKYLKPDIKPWSGTNATISGTALPDRGGYFKFDFSQSGTFTFAFANTKKETAFSVLDKNAGTVKAIQTDGDKVDGNWTDGTYTMDVTAGNTYYFYIYNSNGFGFYGFTFTETNIPASRITTWDIAGKYDKTKIDGNSANWTVSSGGTGTWQKSFVKNQTCSFVDEENKDLFDGLLFYADADRNPSGDNPFYVYYNGTDGIYINRGSLFIRVPQEKTTKNAIVSITFSVSKDNAKLESVSNSTLIGEEPTTKSGQTYVVQYKATNDGYVDIKIGNSIRLKKIVVIRPNPLSFPVERMTYNLDSDDFPFSFPMLQGGTATGYETSDGTVLKWNSWETNYVDQVKLVGKGFSTLTATDADGNKAAVNFIVKAGEGGGTLAADGKSYEFTTKGLLPADKKNIALDGMTLAIGNAVETHVVMEGSPVGMAVKAIDANGYSFAQDAVPPTMGTFYTITTTKPGRLTATLLADNVQLRNTTDNTTTEITPSGTNIVTTTLDANKTYILYNRNTDNTKAMYLHAFRYEPIVATLTFADAVSYVGYENAPSFTVTCGEDNLTEDFTITNLSAVGATIGVDGKVTAIEGDDHTKNSIRDLTVYATLTNSSTGTVVTATGNFRVIPFECTWDFTGGWTNSNYMTATNTNSDNFSTSSSNTNRKNITMDDFKELEYDGSPYAGTKGIEMKGQFSLLYNEYFLRFSSQASWRLYMKAGQQLEIYSSVPSGSAPRFHGYAYETETNTPRITGVTYVTGETDKGITYFNLWSNGTRWQKYIAQADGYVTITNTDVTMLIHKIIVGPETMSYADADYEIDRTYKVVVGKKWPSYQNKLLNKLPEGSHTEYSITSGSNLLTEAEGFDKTTNEITGGFNNVGSVVVHGVVKDADGNELMSGDYTIHTSNMGFASDVMKVGAQYDDNTGMFYTELNYASMPQLQNIPEGTRPEITWEAYTDDETGETSDALISYIPQYSNGSTTFAGAGQYQLNCIGIGKIVIRATAGYATDTYTLTLSGSGFVHTSPHTLRGETSYRQTITNIGLDDANEGLNNPTYFIAGYQTKGDDELSADIDPTTGLVSNITGAGTIKVSAQDGVSHAVRSYFLTVPYPIEHGVYPGVMWNFYENSMHITPDFTDTDNWTLDKWGTSNQYKYKKVMSGNNAFVIKETAGLQIDADVYGLWALNGTTSEGRNIGFNSAKPGTITIPDVPAGAYVDLKLHRHTGNSGEHIKVTNLLDLNGNEIDVLSVTDTRNNNGTGRGTFTLQAKERGDVTITLDDPDSDGFLNFFHIHVYDYAYQSTLNQVVDAAPAMYLDYVEEDGRMNFEVSVSNAIASIPNGLRYNYEFENMSPETLIDEGDNANITLTGGTTLGDATTKATISVKSAASDDERAFGKVKFMMTVYSGDALIGKREQLIHIGPKPKAAYPKTWDFTNIGGGALAGDSDNGYVSVNDDATDTDVTDGTNWTGSGGSYNMKTDPESYYVPGAVLVSHDRIIRETDGLGFTVDNMTMPVVEPAAGVRGSAPRKAAAGTKTEGLTLTGDIIVPDVTAAHRIYVRSSVAPTVKAFDGLTTAEALAKVKPYTTDVTAADGQWAWALEPGDDGKHSVTLSFVGATVGQIGVTDIYKKNYDSSDNEIAGGGMTVVGGKGWATESRARDIDHSLTGYFTARDVNAYVVKDLSKRYDRQFVTVAREEVPVVPAGVGVVLAEDRAEGSDGQAYEVPLFVPAMTTAVPSATDAPFGDNLMRPVASATDDTRVKLFDSEKEDEYTPFILSRTHYEWTQDTDGKYTHPTSTTDVTHGTAAFYRLHVFATANGKNDALIGTDFTDLNTLTRNKAYLLVPTATLDEALWWQEQNGIVPGQTRGYVFFDDGYSVTIGQGAAPGTDGDGDEPRGMTLDEALLRGLVYNAQGQAVQTVVKGGVYIVNGHKFVAR